MRLYAEDIPPFLQYQHVQLVAKVFPDQAQVDEVIDLAEKYWAANPTRHIAIHCAYGEQVSSQNLSKHSKHSTSDKLQ